MKRYECDRCGITLEGKRMRVELTPYLFSNNTMDSDIDLCDECYCELLSWIKETSK